eukprot:448530-Pleurochrysis_carterae.AAC.1
MGPAASLSAMTSSPDGMVRSSCLGAPCSEMPRGAPPPGLGTAPRGMTRAPGSVSSASGSSSGAR